MKAIRLRTDDLIQPLGIDDCQPVLSWNDEGGREQSACEMEAVNEQGEILWKSGIIKSSSMRIHWQADPVAWQTRVIWKVRLYDEENKAGEWSESWFETGLPKGRKWPAHWICGNYKVNQKKCYPMDCFRKQFDLVSIGKARLYITACGLYEAVINGKKAGDACLTPGITDYRRRVQYQTWDVTDLLKAGKNTMSVSLADGWFRGSCGAWGLRNQYGTETKFLALLEVTDKQGRHVLIPSDDTWDWSDDGPVRFADNQDGEIVDARLVPSYAGKAKETDWHVIPSASDNVLVKKHEALNGSLITTPSGKKVIDFHQNIAGIISFSLSAEGGEKIHLRFGEMLDENGEFTQKNIQCSNKHITTPKQEVIYTCRHGLNAYETRFAIFGFQYVLVETELPFAADSFKAVPVSSDLEETSSFTSSNLLLNQFYQNTLWSARNNSCDLPTDCPTRERHGWTGDAQVFAPTANILFNYLPFARKYLNDVYDWQKKNGKLPQIVPEGGTDFYMKAMNGSVGWADAGVLVPYACWKQYGDVRIIRKYLSGMEKYAAFMQKRCGKWYPTAKHTGLKGEDRKYLSNYGQAYGEWAEPDEVHHMTWKDCAVTHPETATAYTAHVMDCMCEMEEALGNHERADQYRDFASHVRKSYQALVRTEMYSLDTDRQARLVRPLAFHMLDEKQTVYAEKRLLKAMDHFDWRVGTGFLSTPLILDVLSKIDIEAAYRLLENEKMPGWLYMPKTGATTVWEAWEGNTTKNGGIASLDHYSKGALCQWLFETMCGIRIAGENTFSITPHPGGHFTHASASWQTVYGKVTSSWKKENHGCTFTVAVPSNCLAVIQLPDGQTFRQKAGTKTYHMEETE
jgi:alpha-L-rhamnosidase